MSNSLIADRKFGQAVSSIKLRSEDREVNFLSATFVDPGITDRLVNDNSQILWGRRGTGKTHVLRMLETTTSSMPGRIGIYVDLSKLGSPGMYEDDRPLVMRATQLFQDLLAEISNSILDYATAPDTDAPGRLLEAQVAFSEAITRSFLAQETFSQEESSTSGRASSAEVSAGVGPPSLRFGVRDATNAEESKKIVLGGVRQPHVDFQELNIALSRVIQASGLERIYIYMDEWVAIPYDSQPLVADFIKRSLLSERQVTIKIAAIEYRTNFGERLAHNNMRGFELGADIGSGLELDDYFVYDRNADKTMEMFGELLYRHIATELEASEIATLVRRQADDGERSIRTSLDALVAEVVSRVRTSDEYLHAEYGIDGPDAFVHALFADQDVFRELVRAGEGVVRDFINVFAQAFLDAHRRDLQKIDLQAVRVAATTWYDLDKAASVTTEQQLVLRRIVEEVIGNRRVRSFLLEKEFERDDMVRSLFDFRLLHLLHRGYVDEIEVGRRYNIYAIDYGAYVELLGSARAPRRDLTMDIQDPDAVVPYGDKRGMKRVVLDPQVLKIETPEE